MIPKRNISFLAASFLFEMAFLPHMYAGNQLAATCSYTDVAAAVAAASRGDTVSVPSGSCQWNTTLSVAESITLQGAGIDTTTITAAAGISTNGLIFYFPADAASESGFTFSVSGFTFDTNGLATDGIHIRNMSSDWVQIRIYENKFVDASTTSTYRMIRNEGTIKGVIHSNTFSTAKKKMVDSYGRNTIEDWSDLPFEFGSSNNIYIEDNTFTHLDTPHSCGQGGRNVIRYNTYILNKNSTMNPWLDAHGNQNALSCVSWSTRGAEWYGNIITSTTNKEIIGLSQRGGQALGFFNKVVTSAAGNHFILWEEYTDTSCSETYTLHINNSYYWGNFLNDTPIIYQITMDNYDRDVPTANNPPVLVENTTHWLQRSGVFDGTGGVAAGGGVGCGTLAARPSSCTPGVGYWATDQSCTDLNGMVGVNPATPISGTLYKCTAPNTWTAYYTPYPYPHPLREERAAGPPQAPQGLRVTN